MKEQEFIHTIKNITGSKYIGDDCAYLKDLGIVVSQDNLTEGVHFCLKYTDARKLGYKSAMVNISDIAASGAEPKYITVGLSLPKNTETTFIEEFYKGIKSAGIEVIGGDITSADKVFISITAIGTTKGRKISSRSNAKEGYKIVVSGNHGSSSAGLIQLQKGLKKSKFINAHLTPKAKTDFSKYISQNIKCDYAMMDTSDGLADALLQIAQASNVKLSVDFGKIPYDKDLENFENYKDLILYGGEDYELVACIPEKFDIPDSYTIGFVEKGNGVYLDGKKINDIQKRIFNHFA